jgi:hypothetical protein
MRSRRSSGMGTDAVGGYTTVMFDDKRLHGGEGHAMRTK